jgi:hypothetical protein
MHTEILLEVKSKITNIPNIEMKRTRKSKTHFPGEGKDGSGRTSGDNSKGGARTGSVVATMRRCSAKLGL